MKQHRDFNTGELVWEIKLESGVTHIGTIEALKWGANVLVNASDPDGGRMLQRLAVDNRNMGGVRRHFFESQRPKR